MADIYTADSDFERDVKFIQWIKGRKYRIVDAGSAGFDDAVEDALEQGIEILIIKGKQNGKQS